MDPVTIIAGDRAEALTELLGVLVEPHHLVTVTPPTFDTQWFVDHPAPTPETESIWWMLTAPERITLTKASIRNAIAELGTMRSLKVTTLAEERRKMLKNRTRTELIDTIPHLAAEIETIDTLTKTLRRTSANLSRIHQDLRYRYRRSFAADEEGA